MAVAFGSNTAASGNTGTAQNPTFALTVAGTNPVITVKVGLDSTTATVTSVGWSGTSNSTGETKNVRNGTAFASHSFIAGPSAGAGTVTVNKSAAGVAHQIDPSCFTGAHQTAPCASADAVTSVSSVTPETLTPNNLTANDASDGMSVNTIADNAISVTPNQRYLDTSTSVNLMTGDATGTTGVTFTYQSGTGTDAKIAVRIKVFVASGVIPSTGAYQQEQSSTDRYLLEDGSGVYLIEPWGQTGVFLPPFFPGDLSGLGTPGRFFKDRLG